MNTVMATKKGGSSVVRLAKNVFQNDLNAAIQAEKNPKELVHMNMCLSAITVANTINAGFCNTTAAIISGICAAISSLTTGAIVTKFIHAKKDVKQAQKAVNDIVNRKDFMDIVNKYLRINGEEELTSEGFLWLYNENKAEEVVDALRGKSFFQFLSKK